MSSWLRPGEQPAVRGAGIVPLPGLAWPEEALRGPVHVDLPRQRAPRGTSLVRLRLPDRPGALAGVTGHFAAHAVNVLRLEVLGRDGGRAIDDFLVTDEGLGEALAALDHDVTVLARRPGGDLRDPGLAMAAACAAVTAARSTVDAHRDLVGAALELVFAEAAFLCLREGYGFLRPVASTVPGLPALDDRAPSLLSSALFSGESLTADGRVPWAPETYRERLPGGAVAVVPGGTPPFLSLVLLRDDPTPFVAAELDRLAALVRVAVGTFELHDAAVTAAARVAS